MVHPVLLAAGAGALIGSAIVKVFDVRRRRLAVQRAFLAFNERIKHEQFEERELLRERRELLTHRLMLALPPEPKARLFTQGSYAMQTGVKPLDDEYDIDIGLEFDCDERRFASPIEAKGLVYDSLRRGKRRVEMRRSCVTVYYAGSAGLPAHHVDIAVYVKSDSGTLLLAKGKRHSDAEMCFWQPTNPEQLTSLVRNKFSGAQVSQFRRCVRYLKRWKQVNFRSPAPYSIALTMAVYHCFRPNADLWLEDVDDIAALLDLVRTLLGQFQSGRLAVMLPVPPAHDLLVAMTSNQMLDFHSKLDELEKALAFASQQDDISVAITALAGQFGHDFK
ncbi:MAG: nucleotidyltransferase [Pseudomonadota bacterium]